MSIKTTKGTMTSGKVKYNGKVLPVQKAYIMKNGDKQLIYSGWHWNKGREIWTFSEHTEIVMSVAVDKNGYVYTASDDGTFKKISPAGKLVWSFPATDTPTAVAVDEDGYVYGGQVNGYILKISPSGTRMWSSALHGRKRVKAIAVDDLYVYGAGGDAIVSKARKTNGSSVWISGEHIVTVSGVDVDKNGYVYTASLDGNATKINPQGKLVWKTDRFPMELNDVAVGEDGFIYVACDDGYITRINNSGVKGWKYNGYGGVASSVTVGPKGFIYAGFGNGAVQKISPEGKKVWVFSGHTRMVHTVAADANGYIYSGSTDKTVRKIG